MSPIRYGFPGGSVVQQIHLPTQETRVWEDPVSGRSLGGWNGNPLHCSCLESPMDRGAWQATVHGLQWVEQWLNNSKTYLLHILCLHATVAKLKSCDRGHMTCEVQIFTVWFFSGRVCWKFCRFSVRLNTGGASLFLCPASPMFHIRATGRDEGVVCPSCVSPTMVLQGQCFMAGVEREIFCVWKGLETFN